MTTRCIQTRWESPVGKLRIALIETPGEPAQCTGVYFPEHHPPPRHWQAEFRNVDWTTEPATRRIVEQLSAYFIDSCHRFDVPCHLAGTAFQNQVWRQLLMIPSGETRSYREIAVEIGRPTAVRAVGAAIARNPISIIVPCHRVVSTAGGLVGFAGGIDRKRFLLEHEWRLGGIVFADTILQPTPG